MKNRQQTIFKRMVVTFSVSFLTPTIFIILLVIIVFYLNNAKTTQQQMENSLVLVANNIDSYLNEMDTITTAPYYHSYFQKRSTIDTSAPSYMIDLQDFQGEMQSLLNLTNYSRDDILDLLVWSNGRYLYYTLYNQTLYFNQSYSTKTLDWYNKSTENGYKTIFASNYFEKQDTGLLGGNSFYMARSINNLANPDQKNLIILNISTKYFDEQFINTNLLFKSFVVITNEDGRIIYSSKPLTSDMLQSVIEKNVFKSDGINWKVVTRETGDFGLDVHVIYSLDDVKHQTLSLIGSILLIYCGGLISAIILFQVFSKWISKSAQAITSTFTKLENGDLSARCPAVNVREYNEIGQSVNKAITRLEEKIKNEYLLTIQQKTVQLYALQSQIHPHFLFNTLYCFIALNQLGEKDKLMDAFYRFASLLRYVLSKEQFTTIEKELEFIDSYLVLQKLRFEERLDFKIECQQGLGDIQIPRLLIQPMVENSVLHGIEPCEHPCYCYIDVTSQDDLITISVIDNGIGFDTSRIPKKTDSVGLYYTRERLKLWNDKASISFESSGVTRVMIHIPMEGSHECIDN